MLMRQPRCLWPLTQLACAAPPCTGFHSYTLPVHFDASEVGMACKKYVRFVVSTAIALQRGEQMHGNEFVLKQKTIWNPCDVSSSQQAMS